MDPSAGAATLSRPDDTTSSVLITFEPHDLPSGALSVHDLVQFTLGLQHIMDGMVRADFEGRDADTYISAFRFVAITATAGSFNLVLVLKPIVDVIQRAFGPSALIDVRPEQLPGLVNRAIASGKVEDTKELANQAQRQQNKMLHFFRDIRANNLEPHKRRLKRPETKRGFKELWDVVKDPSRMTVSLSGGLDGREPIDVDRGLVERVNQPITRSVSGPSVRATGRIASWDRSQRHFMLTISSLHRPVRCRYLPALEPRVWELSQPDLVVTVTGVSYYQIGVAQLPPPHHLDVLELARTPLPLSSDFEDYVNLSMPEE